MIWFLNKRAILLPPKVGSLQFGGYIKSGKFLFFFFKLLPSHISENICLFFQCSASIICLTINAIIIFDFFCFLIEQCMYLDSVCLNVSFCLCDAS